MSELKTKAKVLKKASRTLSMLSADDKNQSLERIAVALLKQKNWIMEENKKDILQGEKAGMSSSLLDRLLLTEDRLHQIVDGVRQLIHLEDPIGQTVETWERPNGLKMESIRVPLGVIGMVYEARPNVTVDAACLCLKAGNAVLLRGSSSAIHSNKALVTVMKKALMNNSPIPTDSLQLLEDTSRETANEMFKLNEYLDVLIPRGGAGLIQSVIKQATVPVLETGVGNCHLFIDQSAKKQMAIDIAVNAKTQRPSVCNTAESLLLQKDWPYIPSIIEELHNQGVELRGSSELAKQYSFMKTATEEDWRTEYLDKILSVKLVDSVQDAIEHINEYGTAHSEAIVSEDQDHVDLFFKAVDAAVLYHNASTRFTDGEQFGYGAEIGISTQKLHARGPMGLRAITTTKTIVKGTGQIRP
ncbi:glutamate-5-semialdehyde dehydrogenase [Oikeobacillus pervagus]|uniref:Gamma-glutamyl phosphate reductase n=1 Tax=Oikeobacillus pervagus TaxID=1325931 RepID=A0AAJ1WHI0_9BACI|nr:glutamate-5-semialdehyde dehydrogenase [Oikeobacillus pervagus]MDQ0213630.1 glutamate-5-semialdehyde dehydrogenase [Oikeobacillus pervagus]